MHVDIASISSRGQFVIPSRFRELLGLKTGSKMVVVSDGTHLLLKPIKRPHVNAYREVIEQANTIAQEAQEIADKASKERTK